MSVDSGAFVFHYLIESGVCYLTLADKGYPKKLAYQYLEDLQREFARLYAQQIDTAARPYAFIKFGALQATLGTEGYQGTMTPACQPSTCCLAFADSPNSKYKFMQLCLAVLTPLLVSLTVYTCGGLADTFIQKTKKQYADTRTQRNIDKLNDDLTEVHSIMTKNIQDVLGQGERLDREHAVLPRCLQAQCCWCLTWLALKNMFLQEWRRCLQH